MIRLLIVFLILGVLGGCSVMDGVRKNFYMTDEEKLAEKEARFAEHREKCTELGFNPEYVEHTNCVLGLEQSWIQAEAVRSAASYAANAAANSMMIHSQPSPIAPAPVIIFAD
jgi:hypothetical protein